jgi:hypothetical protein
MILITACAVSRKKIGQTNTTGVKPVVGNLSEIILNQNITGKSFYIEKAEFRIKSGEGEKSGLGTIKFLMPDKFLISIKSNTGIEVVRIFLTGDSIMVNDRFNKKIFYGSASYLKNKYGITTSLLPVLLGDYVNDEKIDSSRISCEEGMLSIGAVVEKAKVNYVIDCQQGKSILTKPEDSTGENLVEIYYTEFFQANNISIPGKIEIVEKKGNTRIELRIQKIISPWDGSIEFIPGKQFEKIRLQ